MNRWFLLIAIVVLGVLIYALYQSKMPIGEDNHNFPEVHLFHHDKYVIQKITVLQGHEFDLTFSDGRRVLARLAVKTPEKAKDKVVAYINQSNNPTCLVFDKDDEFWTVDILFNSVSLTDWLRAQNLIWDN